jgi:hypothetical protein
MLVECRQAELISDHATDRMSSWPRTEASLCRYFPLWREIVVRRHQNAPSSEPTPATEADNASSDVERSVSSNHCNPVQD